MNAPQPHEPSNLVDELSAYLDGELDNESTQRVEALLATDAHARGELQRLERAWQALNRLTPVEVEPSFTQTTVAMIAVSDAPAPANSAIVRAKRHLRGWLGAAVALLAAGAAGFGILAATDPRTNQRLLQDLPVIENIDLYQQGGNIKFIRSLHQSGLFADRRPPSKDKFFVDKTAPKGTPKDAAPPAATVPVSLAERRAYVEQLSHEQKSELLLKQERFQALSSDERQQLRDLYTALESDSQADELRRTLTRYNEWLSTVAVGDRIELQKLPLDQRASKILEIRQLPARDLAVIQAWIEERLLANLPAEKRQFLEKQPDAERRRLLFREVLMRWQSNEPLRWLTQVSDQEFKDLASRLSPESQQRLQKAATPRIMLAQWTRQALSPYLGGGGDARRMNIEPERLMKFYENLPKEDRGKLLSLPANDFQNRLRGQYEHMQGQQPGKRRPVDEQHGPMMKPKRPEGRPSGDGEERRPFFPNNGERPMGNRPGDRPRPPGGEQPPPRGGEQP